MNYIIKESDTVEKAVSLALEELKADINEVDIDILQNPTNGFLGLMAKDAKVKVSIVNGPKEKAAKFLSLLLKKMNIDCDYEIDFDNDTLDVVVNNIEGKDKGILIGKRGKNLDSLQYVLSLIVNKGRNNYVRTIVDIDGYRDKREKTLERLALKKADKCRYYKKKIKLEPMNPYERRIIHSALQSENDIITYSEGEDPFRRVVIDLK
ncbi:MAG: RNA-binding cell elongation regulator Jag/EloR [Bacillota bacterium]|nr:RNA-binding cell elongation regulator Jag/EloR [Bacillota bacterium]